jgi:protein O-mannosyl-transferase
MKSGGRERRAASKPEGNWLAQNRIWVYAVALAVLGVAIYAPAVQHPFATLDDREYVTGNRYVQAGLASTVPWSLTTSDMGLWHPLTWMSHALDVDLFGEEPWGHHFSSVALHALNCALLFLFLEKATGAAGKSFAVAVLFAVHPLNVESVAWIAERKTVLSTAWFFAAVLAYVWYTHKPTNKRYVAVAGFFALGLMAKAMVVTLPFLALLLDYWPLKRVEAWNAAASKLLLEKIPLLLLAGVGSLLAIWAGSRGHSIVSVEAVPFGGRVQNAIASYAWYAWKLLWPAKLAIFYPLHAVSAGKTAVAALFLVATTALVIRLRRPYLTVGWLWFLGTLVPMIGIVQNGRQAMADRYAYVPEIGIFLMVVWGVEELARRVNVDNRVPVAVLCAAVLALCVTTEIQIGYWSTNLRLWEHTVAVTRDNPVAEDKLGVQLLAVGRSDEAYTHFENVLRMDPLDPLANFDIGVRYYAMGKLQEALRFYEVTVAQPTSPALLADGYQNIGAAYMRLGEFDKARASFQKALEFDPQRPRVVQALASLPRK